MAPLDHAIIYLAGSSPVKIWGDKIAKAAIAYAAHLHRHTSNDLKHDPGRIVAIVFCALFVGLILLAVARILCHKAGCCAARRDAANNDDNDASGSDGASAPSGAAHSGWEDIEPGWGDGVFVGAGVGSRRPGRRGGLRRPRPTVPRERDRAGWKAPPPPYEYIPPPSYDTLGPVGSQYAVYEPRVVGQFERLAPA